MLLELQQHYFEKRSDPRYPNSCALCSRIPEFHIPSPHVPRDPADEQRIQERAVALAPNLKNPQAALHMARTRALPGPVTDADARDNAQEIREEVADAINYATWNIQKLVRAGADGAEKMAWDYVIIKAVDLWDAVTAAEHPEG